MIRWKQAEKVIEEVAATYAKRNVMHLEKCDLSGRIIQTGKKPIFVRVKHKLPDFIGAWTKQHGRCVCIEVKSTIRPVLRVCEKSGLKISQIDALQWWYEAGAAVLVLWECGGRWRSLNMRQIKGRKGATIKRADSDAVNAGNGVLLDFERNLYGASLMP